MLHALREPRTLLMALAGSAILVGTGYAIPAIFLGPRIDMVTTGSVQTAHAGLPQDMATATAEANVPPIPPNLITVRAPAPEAADNTGSAGFHSAIGLIEEGDFERAFTLATALEDGAERRTAQWLAIRQGNGGIGYESVIRFAADAPEFAIGSVFQTRLEQALLHADAGGAEIIRHLGGSMPHTVSAQVALALAYVEDGQVARAARIARAIWVENILSSDDERRVAATLGDLLTKADHWDRAVMLMMHDRATAVSRLTEHMTPAQKSLATARNAVSRNAKDAKRLLDNVDPSMRAHPVYLFSRVQRARQSGLLESAVTWLDKATATDLPEAAEWWYERRAITRQLLNEGKYELAYRAAAGYRGGPDGRMVEALFHAGWIALTWLDDAATAADHFYAMRAYATLPDSVTQTNYWLGRALQALGDNDGAADAFAEAARYGTVYYGLLARTELGDGATVRDMPDAAGSRDTFEARDVVRGVRLLAAYGQRAIALSLLTGLSQNLADGGEFLNAALLAEALGAHDVAISIADMSERKGFPLDPVSFPDDALPVPPAAEVDNAAIFAIARQESRFRADAVSSAGARGLMQLMPGTAEETAGKVGLAYTKSRLTTDPAYNALLGSTYLANQLQTFDGSLVLAAAAYNAGPGNARKWINAYGDPRAADVDPVVWIERIPFAETRKYVQRVVGNYLVYRARFGDTDLRISDVLRRLPE